MRTTTRLLLLTLLTALLISGCSRATLVYRNLDMLVPWSLNDYLDLDRSQQRDLRERLRQHLAWHCSTQLPELLASLQQLERESASGRLEREDLAPHYHGVREAMHSIAVEVTPTATDLLRALSDAQVDELRRSLAENRREHREKYLEPPLEQQIRERAERMQERLQYWFGPLNAEQRQRVLLWAHTLGEQNRRWLDNRERWQQMLLAAVEKRHSDDFDARIARLLQEREALMNDSDRATLQRAERAGLELVADLHTLADDGQRAHLTNRLAQLQTDFGSLKCLPPTA
ncbi:MAG: hypothetical protein CVV19_05655 [Gammaproteobacteria bacterium HGW-Gammaproteobacteria-9]|jgi:hypothetical protein|uniref:Lipoprotein n=1 Tax=Stutzerimonas stutzeri RCH2 TaxID=644801 RepID=L0GQ27_STUST|nr:DUF6279 family lipoprotein [Stutzerimonas stutzeri]AGA87424.1 hypothetical protein Psest_2921 [Stutzerimonas stutzeri RCH2]PKL99916.1 MAG: hypothetical protein CVV19_05655 [Gammaproteobacteria bacterium HGW-Gammaproteobacteria-9]